MKSALACIGVLLLVCAGGWAAVPSSGTLTAPATSGGSSTVSWTGGPYTAVNTDTSTCTSLTCDTFTFTLNVSSTFYTNNPNYTVRVTLAWDTTPNDFDVYVWDASGTQVCSSTHGNTTWEDADCGQLPAGTYTAHIVPFTTVNDSYSGSAILGPEPTQPTGRARYKPGSFTFSYSQNLLGPDDLLFSTWELEPRAAYDSVGNIYVATMQGYPGGTDIFKSVNGGQSWQYMGQPDGSQVAATVGARGLGLGGGDEDIAVEPNGTVNMIALYSLDVSGETPPEEVTSASSSDGGNTWIANPIAATAPLVDRQWIAVGLHAGEVYFTVRQEGAGLVGTDSLFAYKSFDGGKTFPQVSEITRPELGVQPAFQGNLTVDRNTGIVYNVFTGYPGNTIYMAKSTDGGQTWQLKLVLTGPTSASYANVFPVIAVDRGSGLHIAFSDGQNMKLTSSADGGTTWSTPVVVNNGAASKIALMPWLDAGAYGKLDLVFLGTGSASSLDTNATWRVFMVQTQNAFAKVPTFYQSVASDVVHTGPVCVNGTGCPSGSRNLADYFTNTVYYDGSNLIVYPSDQANPGNATTWFTRQTGGPKVLP